MKAHPAAELFPMLGDAELRELAEDIKMNGLLLPIVRFGDLILDGRNRHRACELAGVQPRFVLFGGESPTAYVISVNLKRRHLNTEQRSVAAARAVPLFEEEASARQRAGTLASGEAKGRSADHAARLLNVSGASVERATKVLDKGAPELIAAVERGKVAVSTAALIAEASPARQVEVIAKDDRKAILAAAKEIKQEAFEKKRAAKQELAEQIRREPPPIPSGRYRVIVLDPPWRYEKRAEDPTHRSTCPYPDMSLEEICALPVAERAHKDAIVWLWTTNAFMRDAFACLDAWGFHAKTILTWVKDRMGTGDWLRGRSEHCILAVRGKPVVMLTNQTTVLEAAMREHSRKPDEFYALVEALCPGSKLEFFAREAREGWAQTGAEKDRFRESA